MVTRYAQQMKTGAIFPAIVVNELGELIDGNTRRRAAVKAGRSTMAAYICRDLTPLQARSLSVELNQANGLAMDEKELHAYVQKRRARRADPRHQDQCTDDGHATFNARAMEGASSVRAAGEAVRYP